MRVIPAPVIETDGSGPFRTSISLVNPPATAIPSSQVVVALSHLLFRTINLASQGSSFAVSFSLLEHDAPGAGEAWDGGGADASAPGLPGRQRLLGRLSFWIVVVQNGF